MPELIIIGGLVVLAALVCAVVCVLAACVLSGRLSEAEERRERRP